MNPHASERFFAVDRLEGERAVLVADDGATTDLLRSVLPVGIREGTVLRVPLGGDGAPDWRRASIDAAETRRRLSIGRDALERLRRRDPGGDVKL